MNLLINNKLCPQCLSSDIIHDEFHALFYCGDCGLVVKDSTIINDNDDVLIQEQGKRKLKVELEKVYFDLTGEYMQ